ncbi:hypothetical protein N7489_005718 [Penicillium chrysogenum]|uniref:uncharacterized protein n=1 Tax=Penicillium chrysogenum TaxID=5076 RepID=UPI0024DF1173|nr:uncharacterized protein N7489_005718 [Penicillium chrysogenum]KAJ5245622.1 hypothetical protein N7489_005718 [Penicillium chrysogenum]
MVPECYLKALPRAFNFNFSNHSCIPTTTKNYIQPGSITNIYKVGDTRPIPSPNDAQLERLTSLTERAHRRSRQRNKIAKEETRILDAKEQIMAVNQFDYATQRQLNQMVGQLERLNDVLIDVLNEEEMDAIEEERIWSQMG